MRGLILALAIPVGLGAGVPATAGGCLFTRECVDREACADTSFQVDLEQSDGFVVMSSIAGERVLAPLQQHNGHRAFASGPESGAIGVLNITDDGSAWYRELGLLASDYTLEYRGTCLLR